MLTVVAISDLAHMDEGKLSFASFCGSNREVVDFAIASVGARGIENELGCSVEEQLVDSIRPQLMQSF
ncbi:hypothetical protein ACT3UA_16100 [Glutamicibacter sp. 363]|uniref:hypothetical protein n=1 Tax=Glutamicibacter sp. 363 TaxID=3457731 RepID=UPI004034361D